MYHIGLTWDTLVIKASAVCPDNVRPLLSTIVPEIYTQISITKTLSYHLSHGLIIILKITNNTHENWNFFITFKNITDSKKSSLKMGKIAICRACWNRNEECSDTTLSIINKRRKVILLLHSQYQIWSRPIEGPNHRRGDLVFVPCTLPQVHQTLELIWKQSPWLVKYTTWKRGYLKLNAYTN